jgi:hypothetical protein
MTATAMNRGAKNALITLGGLICVWGALTALLFGMTFLKAIPFAFLVSWIVIFIAFLAIAVRGRFVRGQLLLDCGPHPTWWLFLLNAGLFFVLASGGNLYFFRLSDTWNTISSYVFGGSFVCYWLFMAAGRLQFYQRGIWQYWSLLPWEKIGSASWGPGSTLLITSTSRWKGRGALPVPPENGEAVDLLLKKHLPRLEEV